MNQEPKAINPLAAAELLYQEALPEGSLAEKFTDVPNFLMATNTLRLAKQLPMASAMSLFNPAIEPCPNTLLNTDLVPLRALWQQGMIHLIKQDISNAKAMLLSAATQLGELDGDNWIHRIAKAMHALLSANPTQMDALIDLARRFDLLLSQHENIQAVPAENLLRDTLFYSSYSDANVWQEDEEAKTYLRARIQWYAKFLSDWLVPQDSDTKVLKSDILVHLLPITDGLLFTGEIKLRTRLQLRFEKLDDSMLKIAVPVQKLMAECLRLSV